MSGLGFPVEGFSEVAWSVLKIVLPVWVPQIVGPAKP